MHAHKRPSQTKTQDSTHQHTHQPTRARTCSSLFPRQFCLPRFGGSQLTAVGQYLVQDLLSLCNLAFAEQVLAPLPEILLINLQRVSTSTAGAAGLGLL